MMIVLRKMHVILKGCFFLVLESQTNLPSNRSYQKEESMKQLVFDMKICKVMLTAYFAFGNPPIC